MRDAKPDEPITITAADSGFAAALQVPIVD
jgi:hypothetical protein